MGLTQIMNNDLLINEYISKEISKYSSELQDIDVRLKISLYECFLKDDLIQLFSYYHFFINNLFQFINSRISNGTITAQQSRDLINLISNIEKLEGILSNSEVSFELDTYYSDIISKCKGFLRDRNGSDIPSNFDKIKIIEGKPIFLPVNSILIQRNQDRSKYLKKVIGDGSYAIVYKYDDDYYNIRFAIKKAKKDLSEKELERFKNEFKIMKNLNHPFITRVYRYDEIENLYIMEFADETLFNYITKNNNQLDNKERIKLVNQVLNAFSYLHEKDILHRDISYTNILIKKFEGVNFIKVSDFGLVKLKDSNLTSKSTELKGSLNDPKLELEGFNNYKLIHETYALTRLIYFILTGKTSLDSKISENLSIFIKKGISDNPMERYQNLAELKNSFNLLTNSL
jgi:eukaryotic-like serine/threonine-protein kinase